MKHLSNSSTIIFYSNLSIILYDTNFSYTNTFAISNNSDAYKIDLSEKDTILIVYTKDYTGYQLISLYSMLDQSFKFDVNGMDVIYMNIFEYVSIYVNLGVCVCVFVCLILV